MNLKLILIKFEKFIIKTFLIPSFVWQSLIVFSCLIMAILIGFLIKKLLKISSERFEIQKKSIASTIFDYLKIIMSPSLLLLFLSIGSLISLELFDNDVFISLFIQIASVWLIINAVKAFSRNRALSIFVGIMLFIILI